jgi:sulfur carrier protein
MSARTLRVNGTDRASSATTLGQLLVELGFEPPLRGIAVALNDEMIPRGRWNGQPLAAGDRIDIVGAVQGG